MVTRLGGGIRIKDINGKIYFQQGKT